VTLGAARSRGVLPVGGVAALPGGAGGAAARGARGAAALCSREEPMGDWGEAVARNVRHGWRG